MKERGMTLKVLLFVLFAMATLAVPGMAQAVDPKDPQPAVVDQKGTQEQTAEERPQTQEERINALEKRLEGIESAVMSGTAPGPAPVKAAEVPAAPEAKAPERIDLSAGQSRDLHEVLTGADLTSKEFPGSWPMFGSDYRMKVGGYLKVDALYDLDGSGDIYQFLISQIPVDGTPEAGRGPYFNMFVKETRFSFDFRKTTAGELAQQVFIEMDFFDESSSSPRLRHAYLVYGNLIIGQTWSTLTEGKALPYMIDFAYGDALFGGRTAQVRWQQQAGKNWTWAVGIEKLNFSGIDNPLALPGVASPAVPLLAARATYEDSNTLVMLGAAVNELRWDGEGLGPNSTATAWVVVCDGRQNLGEHDYATWGLSYGDGVAENISALAGGNVNATVLPGGHLDTNKSWSAALGLAHKWNENLTTNLAYAQTELEENDFRAPESIKGGWVAHANLIWKVTKVASTGIEYMWGQRENRNGAKGDAARLQTMVQYFF